MVDRGLGRQGLLLWSPSWLLLSRFLDSMLVCISSPLLIPENTRNMRCYKVPRRILGLYTYNKQGILSCTSVFLRHSVLYKEVNFSGCGWGMVCGLSVEIGIRSVNDILKSTLAVPCSIACSLSFLMAGKHLINTPLVTWIINDMLHKLPKLDHFMLPRCYFWKMRAKYPHECPTLKDNTSMHWCAFVFDGMASSFWWCWSSPFPWRLTLAGPKPPFKSCSSSEKCQIYKFVEPRGRSSRGEMKLPFCAYFHIRGRNYTVMQCSAIGCRINGKTYGGVRIGFFVNLKW